MHARVMCRKKIWDHKLKDDSSTFGRCPVWLMAIQKRKKLYIIIFGVEIRGHCPLATMLCRSFSHGSYVRK